MSDLSQLHKVHRKSKEKKKTDPGGVRPLNPHLFVIEHAPNSVF